MSISPEPLIAVRQRSAAGRSTARIDDETVTAAPLADEVGSLVEIHGQHDQGRLLDERWQRDLLDAYGEHAQARAAMASAVDAWRENRTALEAAALDPREVARRLDVLDHEAAESPPPSCGRARWPTSGRASSRPSTARRSPAVTRPCAMP